MSDNEKKIIQWADLDSYKKRFFELMEDGLGRTWLWMYFSGFSVEDIAAEYSCSKTRVYVSLKTNIEKYNQFIREEKEKAATQKATQIQTKKTASKQAIRKQTGGSAKTAHEQAVSRPVTYRPKKQSQRIYSKLRKRIDAQFDKKFYIGDIQVSQEEYAELLEYVRVQLRNVTASSSALGDAPILAVAMVQIGIRCYNGNYWGNALKQELKMENSQVYQRFLGESFIQTLKKHNKYILDESEKVQTILFHSFVTDYYSKGLFELLFQYYAKDLERDINRNDKYQMQALMETIQLRAEMSEEESEAFTGQFTGRGSRAYKLRQHTLQAITANPTHSSMRLRRILRLMDKAFWKDSVPQKPVSRLTILFKEWLKESPSFNSEYKLYKSGVIRNRGKKHFSSPYLFADIKNTRFTLVLPPQIVRQDQSENLSWHVSVAGRTFDTPASTYPVLTGFKTEEVRLPIPTDLLFSEINCSLRTDNSLARSFPALPQANARMFDMEGDYAARLFKIPMCVYTRNDFSVKSPALLDVIRLGNLTRWDLEFVEGDVLIFSDGKSLVAGERYVEGLTKRGIVSEAVHHDNDGKNVPVYNRVPDLLLTLSKERVSGTVIDINGSRYRLSECDNDDFEAGDARGVRAFLIPLAQFPECSEGTVNRIIIDAPGSTYAREYLFVYVQDLKTKFDGAPYVFEERGTLVFPENIRVACNNPDAERLHGENGFQFLLSQELRTIPIQINNSITVNFEVPMFLWSSDEKEWKTEPMGDVWHSDFKALRKLYFHSPNDRLEFSMDDDYDDSDDQSEQHVVSCEKRSDGVFVLDLTRFHSWITRDKIAHGITMRLGSSNYDFARVYARSFVSSCDLSADYQTGQLTCSGEFIGRSDYYVDITHLQTGIKIVEKGHITDGEFKLTTRLRNGDYQVDYYETEEDDDDFFDEVSYLPIHSFKKHLINHNDLSGYNIKMLSYRQKMHSLIHTRFAHALWISNLEYIEPQTYEGHMKTPDGEELLVKVVFENSKDLRYFELYFWDEYDETFVEFLFDNQEKTIVREEEPGLRPSVRYRRYKVLFDSDYMYYGSVEERIEADSSD